MPQQINLCTPILLTQKRYFSAHTMLRALAVFVLLGGVLTAYGVWSLNSAASVIRATQRDHAPELAQLRAALAANQAQAGAGAQALAQELQSARGQLAQRQKTLAELRSGLMPAGQGHSARLQLVAQSIPAQVWVTDVRADVAQLEVRGYTLEPAVLNDWLARLAQSPLLAGQRLSRVKVEQVVLPLGKGSVRTELALAQAGPASLTGARPVWSFTLASALPPSAAPVPGSRP